MPTLIFSMLSIVGEPLPYSFRNDDLITGLLLVCFLLINWVVAGSWRFMRNYVKGFSRLRERENLFMAEEGSRLRGGLPFVALTSFLISLLFFKYVQNCEPHSVAEKMPHAFLGIITGTVFLFYLLKFGLYAAVNGVFFSRWQRELWRQDYMVSVFGFGFVLFPLVLLVVYLHLDYPITKVSLIALLIVLKSLQLYRCARIFFPAGSYGLHLFLYFCTLEIAPLLFLWQILLFAHRFLTTIY